MPQLSRSVFASPSPFYTAAPVLATVNTLNFACNQTSMPFVGIDLIAVMGGLSSIVVTPYVLRPDSLWYPLTDPGALTITAGGNYSIPACIAGAKQLRLLITSTGSGVGSSITANVSYVNLMVTN